MVCHDIHVHYVTAVLIHTHTHTFSSVNHYVYKIEHKIHVTIYYNVYSTIWFYQATSSTDVPPVIATPHYYLITVYRCKIYFVAVVQSEGK